MINYGAFVKINTSQGRAVRNGLTGLPDTKGMTKDMINEILVRRKNKLILNKGVGTVANSAYIATIMKNVEDLGYTFAEDLYECLGTYSEEELQQFYMGLLPILKAQRGADVQYHPMYPNFPQSVMQEEETRLYLNAMIHYWSYGKLYPNIKKEKRLPLFEDTKVTVLSLGTEEDIVALFRQLVGANTSISDQDKEDLACMFAQIPGIIQYLPQTIAYKENAAYIGKLYVKHAPIVSAEALKPYFKTATDVLRFVTAMSDGDISLSKNCKFKSFSRAERRVLLELLNSCGGLEEDMVRNKERFIRLGERLHVGEYANRYPRAYRAFEKLRNGEKIRTYGGRLALAFERKDFVNALELLKERPGEFARKLDYALRTCLKSADKELVVASFAEVAGKVATPVLLQVREHFIHRNSGELRVYFPKGKLAQARCIETPLRRMDENVCAQIVEICNEALTERFKNAAPMGKVYVADSMKNYLVPFNQRSASKSIKTIVPGSRISIAKDTKAFRGFIWWTNEENGRRVDIDLSAVIFDENFHYMEHISYTNLRSKTYAACHSGDITDGGRANGAGVSEFLDVDIDAVVANGARYLVYQVYCYTGQNFVNLPHVKFGFMERADVNSGEIYEPKTVKQKINLTSSSSVAVPVIFDCVERKVIWCDMNLELASCARGGNNVESNLSSVELACYSVVHMHKPTIYDLVQLHVKARGTLCDNAEEADLVFDEETGITPFDAEIFMSEYLA